MGTTSILDGGYEPTNITGGHHLLYLQVSLSHHSWGIPHLRLEVMIGFTKNRFLQQFQKPYKLVGGLEH